MKCARTKLYMQIHMITKEIITFSYAKQWKMSPSQSILM